MNEPEKVAPRRGISMRMLAQQKDGQQTARERRQGIAVRRFVDLQAAITEKHLALARQIGGILASQGFSEQHLDDMIYEIADQVSGMLITGTDCDVEYQAANELNTKPMTEQLAVLAVWFGGEEGLQAKLKKDLLVSF